MLRRTYVPGMNQKCIYGERREKNCFRFTGLNEIGMNVYYYFENLNGLASMPAILCPVCGILHCDGMKDVRADSANDLVNDDTILRDEWLTAVRIFR